MISLMSFSARWMAAAQINNPPHLQPPQPRTDLGLLLPLRRCSIWERQQQQANSVCSPGSAHKSVVDVPRGYQVCRGALWVTSRASCLLWMVVCCEFNFLSCFSTQSNQTVDSAAEPPIREGETPPLPPRKKIVKLIIFLYFYLGCFFFFLELRV